MGSRGVKRAKRIALAQVRLAREVEQALVPEPKRYRGKDTRIALTVGGVQTVMSPLNWLAKDVEEALIEGPYQPPYVVPENSKVLVSGPEGQAQWVNVKAGDEIAWQGGMVVINGVKTHPEKVLQGDEGDPEGDPSGG